MKKFVSVMMALAMVLSLAACGSNAAPESTEAVPASALEILENTWAKFPEEERFFVYGGAYETHAEILNNLKEGEMYTPASQPENYDMAYAESLSYTMYIPAESIALIEEAATMTHAQNANTFTSGVFRLSADADVKALGDTMKDALMNNMWFCGTPEQLIIATIADQYMLIAFGGNDAMNPFVTHFTEAYPAAQILHNEPIV